MPEIKEVTETFDRLKALHIKKNDDYSGNQPNAFYNFDIATVIQGQFDKPHDKTFATLVGIKLARIAALLNSKNAPKNESILDSFDDAIVYLAIWRANLLRGVGLANRSQISEVTKVPESEQLQL